MPRNARIIVKDEAAVYHIMSRTALDGFVLKDAEKDYLLKLIKEISAVYFAEILGFCLMGNHFHLVTRMRPGREFSDKEIHQRFARQFQASPKKELTPGQVPFYRQKWASLSEFSKEIKQRFSRYYNKRHNRRGFFWGERFKSVLVEDGETLINLLAYVELNPVRAGITATPDDYRWNSLGYHLQTNNKDGFLSLDFGIVGHQEKSKGQLLTIYRQFVYEKGSIPSGKGAAIDKKIMDREQQKNFKPGMVERFLKRTRYFTDSGIIGSREFIRRGALLLGGDKGPGSGQSSKRIKNPLSIKGLEGIYSLKRVE